MILIVDDIAENVFSLQKVLEFHGFQVDTAFSGEEALRKILSKQYVLILLDVQMPGIDGFEVAQNIKGFKKAKDTAVVFLSANYTDINTIIKGYGQGAVDYITKPVDTDLLLLKVKTIYRLYQAKQDNSREHQEIVVLYEHAREYNEKLLKKIDKYKEILDLAGIAQFEYYAQEEHLYTSAQLNRIFTGNEEMPVNKDELFQKLNLSPSMLSPQGAKKNVFSLNYHSDREKDFKVSIQAEYEGDVLTRVLGIVQETKSELV